MAKKYHISGAGEAAICPATIQCRLTNSDGSSVAHEEFDSPLDAKKWAEAEVAKRFGNSFSQEEVTEKILSQAEKIDEWEAENEDMYAYGTIVENAPRQWDVDYLESAVELAEDSQLARETIDYFQEKVTYAREESENYSEEELKYLSEIEARLEAYDALPWRAAEIQAEEEAAAAYRIAAAEYKAQEEAEEKARWDSLSKVEQWEETWEDTRADVGSIMSLPIAAGSEEALAAAVEVADESYGAMEVIEAYRYAANTSNDYYDEGLSHDVESLKKVNELLTAYDNTPRRRIEIAAEEFKRSQRNLMQTQLSSPNPDVIRQAVADHKKATLSIDREALIANNAAPADLLRSEVLPHIYNNDEMFVKLYNHPSKPFANVSVKEFTDEDDDFESYQAYDYYAKKIDSGKFYKKDLDELRADSSDEEYTDILITEPLKRSLFARLRAHLNNS